MKKILILLVGILVFYINAHAGTTNLVTLPSTTHSYTLTYWGGNYTQNESNVPGYSIDENFSTYYGGRRGHNVSGAASVTCISQHNFSAPRTVTSIKYRGYVRGYTSGQAGGNWSCLFYVQYLPYGGSWTDIYRYSNGGGGDSEGGIDTGEVTYSTPLSNVVGIKIYAYGWGQANEGNGQGSAFIYEIEAFGTAYEDIGLRFSNNGTTYKIGGEDATSSHKLRFYDGSKTWGIPLLATNDSDASPLRIYDGASVKALPKTD